MPDLHRSSALAWLNGVAPSFARRCSAAIRPLEDVAAVHPLLVEFGAALDRACDARPACVVPALLGGAAGAELREVLAQLGPARLLRLLAWFDGAPLPEHERLREALLADGLSDAGEVLHAMLRELHRQALLARIFSPDRLAALLRACSTDRKEAV